MRFDSNWLPDLLSEMTKYGDKGLTHGHFEPWQFTWMLLNAVGLLMLSVSTVPLCRVPSSHPACCADRWFAQELTVVCAGFSDLPHFVTGENGTIF